ncbi:MAG: ribonuclease H-like domain-containing protein [Microgenomates group bacterium]
MNKLPIIIDLETKYTFRQFKDPRKLGISVVAVFDYRTKQKLTFLEKEIPGLFPILENASYVIGYNIKDFDLPVLQGYYPGKIENFSIFDLIEDIKEKTGKRLALNDLLQATLNKKKTGHGLQAINYYQEGEWEKLKKYCLDDVLLTKELFEYGVENKKIYYLNEKGKVAIKVDWEKYLKETKNSNNIPLTLPF